MGYNYNNFNFNGYNCKIEHTKRVFDTTDKGNFRRKPFKTETEMTEKYIDTFRFI